MKRTLRLVIQAAWLLVGAWSVYLAFALLRTSIVFITDHRFEWSDAWWLVFDVAAWSLATGILGVLIFAAWRAVVSFSATTISATVFISSLPLFHLANQADSLFIDAYLNPHLGIHPAMPFLGLGLTFVIFLGWIAYLRIMPRILTRYLYSDFSAAALP